VGVLKLTPVRYRHEGDPRDGQLSGIGASITLHEVDRSLLHRDVQAIGNEWLAAHGAPKSIGAKGSSLSAGARSYAYIGWNAQLRADGVNGGRNETGIARFAALLRWAEKAGITVDGDGAALLAEARA
jgi:hypothetical protein